MRNWPSFGHLLAFLTNKTIQDKALSTKQVLDELGWVWPSEKV